MKTSEYKEKFLHCQIVYIGSPDIFCQNYAEFLDILGIDYSCFVCITKITQYEKLILPDESWFYQTQGGKTKISFTKEYKQMIQTVKDYARSTKPLIGFEKIYFSYRGYRINIGEEKLEKFFHSFGYRIIAPQNYSFKEQLAMLSSCKYLASTIGSCSHNAMFLEEGSHLILIPRANRLTFYQLAIDELSNLKVTYIDSNLSIFCNQKSLYEGPFYFYISQNLQDFFGFVPKDKSFWKKNLKDFKKYIFCWLFSFKKTVAKYYSLGKSQKDILRDFCYSPPDYYMKVLQECAVQYITAQIFFAPVVKLIKIFRCAKSVARKIKHFAKKKKQCK